MNPISDEEGGNAYLVNGNMIPINLCGIAPLITALTAAEGTEDDVPPDNTQDTDDKQPEEKPMKSPQKRRKQKEEQK